MSQAARTRDGGRTLEGRERRRPGRRGRRRGTAVAVLAVLPWVVLALVRWLGLDRALPFPLVPVLAFTPYLAAAAPLPVLLALLLRRWRTAVLGTLAAVLLAALVLPRAVPAGPPDPAPTGPPLRVLTVNLHFGHADPVEVVRLVEAERVDLLALQEVTPEAAEGLEHAGLGEVLPHAVTHAAPAAAGGAVHSRYPLTDLGDPGRDIESLYMPQARVDVPDAAPVEITSVHPMSPRRPGSMPQWTAGLRALPETEPGGAVRILAGDFNATLDHAELRAVLDGGYVDAASATGRGFEHTWPVRHPLPMVAIDHVLVDPRVGVESAAVREVPDIKHRAVLTELVLPEG